MPSKILVLTPMKKEYAVFARSCTERGCVGEFQNFGRITVTNYPELNLSLARGGTGKVQFAVRAQHLLDSGLQPDLVICAGAAGALVDHLSVGDVVVGESTIEHDIQERFIDKPLPMFKAPTGQ